jgi:enoyl-CoA hydratase/carnithine racemase
MTWDGKRELHGFAIGAGLVLSTLCDFRVASASCKFSMPEIAVGISVAGGGSQLRRLGLREGFIRGLLRSDTVHGRFKVGQP